ncbi:MAG: rhodanese-like domain-containing protein [Chlorobi bacterium]|nr:rhodanese-like domain-containing protein [Chlorobiota bacterium]
MRTTDKIVIIGLLLGSVWLFFSGKNTPEKGEIPPGKLHELMLQKHRDISADELTERIINGDPLLQIVDVRDTKEYENYTLSGAINIPLKDILKKDNLAYFDQDVLNTVIFSNGTSDAQIAWNILTRLGYKNLTILKGGLNNWFETIILAKPPTGPYDKEADELYQFRKGARVYFGVGGGIEEESAPKPKVRIPIIKHKKKEVEGGCS